MTISPHLAFDVCHSVYESIRGNLEGIPLIDPTKVPSDHLWNPGRGPRGQEYVADFCIACQRALGDPQHASRLVLCRIYYLAGVPYERTRHFLGLKDDVMGLWTDEIRTVVGRVLMQRGMFPPRTYFGERTRPRKRVTPKPLTWQAEANL